MAQLSYRPHRFPASIIQHAIWLYLRFMLSHRGVEDLLAERGLDISYETVRRWVLKFGPLIALKLRQRRPPPSVWPPPMTWAPALVDLMSDRENAVQPRERLRVPSQWREHHHLLRDW